MTVNSEMQETLLAPQTWYEGALRFGRTTYKGRKDCTIGALYKFKFKHIISQTTSYRGGVTGGSIVSEDDFMAIVRATNVQVGFEVRYQCTDRENFADFQYDDVILMSKML